MSERETNEPQKIKFKVSYINASGSHDVGVWESTSTEQLKQDLKSDPDIERIIAVKTFNSAAQTADAFVDSPVITNDEDETIHMPMSKIQEENMISSQKNFVNQLLSGKIKMPEQDTPAAVINNVKPATPIIQRNAVQPQMPERIVELSSGDIIKIDESGQVYERVWIDVEFDKQSELRLINPKTKVIYSSLPEKFKLQKLTWVKKS